MSETPIKFSIRSSNFWLLFKSKRLWSGFFLLVTLAILLYLIYRERETLLEFQWQFRFEYLFLFVIFHILAMLAQSAAWHMIMTRMTGIRRLWLDFQVYTISLVSRRIPGLPWYIGSRFALYPLDQVPPKIIAIVTGIEFGLIGFAGIICYLLFIPFYSISYNWPWQAFLGIGILIFLLIFLKPGILIDLTNLLLKALHREQVSVTISRTDLFLWLFVYLLTWCLDGISLFFWLISLAPHSPIFIDAIGVSTISALVSYAAQFLPTAFALKEISMSALLGIWIPTSVGLVLALGYRIGMLLVELLLALFFRIDFSSK